MLCTGIKSESEGSGLQPPGESHSACLLMELRFHREDMPSHSTYAPHPHSLSSPCLHPRPVGTRNNLKQFEREPGEALLSLFPLGETEAGGGAVACLGTTVKLGIMFPRFDSSESLCEEPGWGRKHARKSGHAYLLEVQSNPLR